MAKQIYRTRASSLTSSTITALGSGFPGGSAGKLDGGSRSSEDPQHARPHQLLPGVSRVPQLLLAWQPVALG